MNLSTLPYWKQLDVPAKRELLIAISIPLSLYLIQYIRQTLEYFFRFSKSYKWIYSWGSSIGLLFQMLILLFSVAFALNTLLMYRERKVKSVWALSLVIASFPVTFLALAVLFQL
jgi:hypothetical protein